MTAIDYTRDQWGRRIPRRTANRRCEDCGQTPTRMIHFDRYLPAYWVCAQHEHEYCGTPRARAVDTDSHRAVIAPAGMHMTPRGWEGVTA